MDMEEREDPQPLTDEELAEFEKKRNGTQAGSSGLLLISS